MHTAKTFPRTGSNVTGRIFSTGFFFLLGGFYSGVIISFLGMVANDSDSVLVLFIFAIFSITSFGVSL